MKRALLLLALAGPALLAAACGSDAAADDDDDVVPGSDAGGSSSSSGGASSSSGGPAAPDCHATPQPDDALRFIAASRPYSGGYTDAGSALMASRFSVWSLASNGTIAAVEDFELGGYNTAGRIAFTPDGRVGAVALESRTQEDRGTVGVFRLDDAGHVTVVHTKLKGPFFSQDVAFSPDGNFLFVADTQAAKLGGGLYAAPVACDGSVGEFTRLTSAIGTTVPLWVPSASAAPWRALVAADQTEGHSDVGLHVYDFVGSSASWRSGTDAFGQQTLVQDMAFDPSGKHALLTAPNPNVGGPRTIAVRLDDTEAALDEAFDLEGSETVAASPFGNAFFVATADPDGVYSMQFAPGAEHAFQAPVAIGEEKVQLPFAAHVIDRGALRGRIVFAEISSIRQFQFAESGSITNVSTFEIPAANEDDISGVLGGFGVGR